MTNAPVSPRTRLLAATEPAGDAAFGLLGALDDRQDHCSIAEAGLTHLFYVLVERVHGLVQLGARRLKTLVDALLGPRAVLLQLLIHLVSAVASLRSESVGLLASVGGEDLGVLAELGAFAGSVVLRVVLELGGVGCEKRSAGVAHEIMRASIPSNLFWAALGSPPAW